ncbi:MAG: phage holin family protein [Chitinophagaceae bacterium]
MENIKQTAENLVEHVGQYVDTYSQLAIVNVTQKATGIISFGVVILVTCFFSLFILFFVGLGTAWWLGEVLKSRIAGFFVVGGVFAIVLLVLFLIRKSVIYPFVRNIIVSKVYE